MTGSLPSGPRIDRGALERIIRRAAELQAGERDIGEGLTEPELYALGQDVGIGDRHLRQALLEERTRAVTESERGPLIWLAGPRRAAAGRSIPRPRPDTERTLHAWMTEGELLQVKRRYPEQTTWEAQQGAYASLKRAFGSRGRRYVLARAREVAGAITEVDQHSCHVQLTADIGNAFNEQLTGAAVLGASGLAGTGVALAVGVMVPVAIIPVAICGALAVGVARRQRQRAAETSVALEQVLDRLEHGELDLHRAAGSARTSPLVRVADEIRRTLSPRGAPVITNPNSR
ncbi:MAG: hypothetical protein A3K13_08165 [Gemmatimonadetes bacterium RIFCSPLOWO2_12_FULL_68_9]|nr:MAG: hypothetical protein A3K13_08165 [Gemmatimonadetes bacterium RIFCSPLOWO2_12_FULL_68_9]